MSVSVDDLRQSLLDATEDSMPAADWIAGVHAVKQGTYDVCSFLRAHRSDWVFYGATHLSQTCTQINTTKEPSQRLHIISDTCMQWTSSVHASDISSSRAAAPEDASNEICVPSCVRTVVLRLEAHAAVICDTGQPPRRRWALAFATGGTWPQPHRLIAPVEVGIAHIKQLDATFAALSAVGGTVVPPLCLPVLLLAFPRHKLKNVEVHVTMSCVRSLRVLQLGQLTNEDAYVLFMRVWEQAVRDAAAANCERQAIHRIRPVRVMVLLRDYLARTHSIRDAVADHGVRLPRTCARCSNGLYTGSVVCKHCSKRTYCCDLCRRVDKVAHRQFCKDGSACEERWGYEVRFMGTETRVFSTCALAAGSVILSGVCSYGLRANSVAVIGSGANCCWVCRDEYTCLCSTCAIPKGAMLTSTE